MITIVYYYTSDINITIIGLYYYNILSSIISLSIIILL